tara:strand:+ start:1580 stop:2617 length:1038 start_codon:yes stop_codon:yes gene_type:complete
MALNYNILVTGGSGYFGSLLLDKTKNYFSNSYNFDLIKNEDSEIKTFLGDIRDYNTIYNITKNIDIIFHNVAQVPIAKNKDLFESVNITGTENLLKAALKNNVQKIVLTSSSAIFGVPKSNPVDETTNPNPMDPYGKAKFQSELLCSKYIQQGMDISIIRPRTILGHGRLGIFQIIFDWIKNGYNVPVIGKGDNLYQFVHASDLADACISASLLKGPEIFNCGAKEFGTMYELLHSLCIHANTGSKVSHLPKNLTIFLMKLTSKLNISPLGDYHSLMYDKSMYFSNDKTYNMLNWKPKYSNEEMIKDSYDWYLENHSKIGMNTNKTSAHRSKIKQGVLGIVKRII